MRAILIDPEKRTLSEIQISNDDKEHRAILQCESVTRLARIGSYEQGVDGLYVSDESDRTARRQSYGG